MRDMIVFRFRPLDVLLFRDGHPFGAGVSFATTLPYPYPSTFSGALRKLFGELLGISTREWNDAFGDASMSTLLFSGPFVEKNGKIYVKAPKVLMAERKSKSKKAKSALSRFSKIVKNSSLVKITSSSFQSDDVFWSKSSLALEPVEGFIDAGDLVALIEGKKTPEEVEIHGSEEFFSYDLRTHIKIIGRTVAEEGGKFSVRYLSLKEGVSFVAVVEKGTFLKWEELKRVLPEKSVIRLGGEGRHAVVERVKEDEIFKTLQRLRDLEDEPSSERVFLTPLAFEEGNLPVKAAVTSKPLILRGRDYKRMSRIYAAYDSGSVFVFEDFEKLKSEKWFVNFRTLGYNMSLKGGRLI